MNIGGKKINNWYIVGGAAGLALVIYLYRRSSSGSSSSSGSAAGTGTNPVTGLPYSQDNAVDPLTGMTYLQEAQTYGSVAAAEAQGGTGGGYGLGGGYGGFGGTAGFPTSNVGAGSAAGQSFATNAAWAQAVQAGLSALGYDPQTVAAALGLFFAQHPLSATQAQIVQAAEAEFGPPPQGTYQIIPQGSGNGGTGTGGGGGGTGGGGGGDRGLITVPDLAGRSAGDAHNALVALGLVPTAPPQQRANMKVWYTNPRAGSEVSRGTHVTIDTKGYV